MKTWDRTGDILKKILIINILCVIVAVSVYGLDIINCDENLTLSALNITSEDQGVSVVNLTICPEAKERSDVSVELSYNPVHLGGLSYSIYPKIDVVENRDFPGKKYIMNFTLPLYEISHLVWINITFGDKIIESAMIYVKKENGNATINKTGGYNKTIGEKLNQSMIGGDVGRNDRGLNVSVDVLQKLSQDIATNFSLNITVSAVVDGFYNISLVTSGLRIVSLWERGRESRDLFFFRRMKAGETEYILYKLSPFKNTTWFYVANAVGNEIIPLTEKYYINYTIAKGKVNETGFEYRLPAPYIDELKLYQETYMRKDIIKGIIRLINMVGNESQVNITVKKDNIILWEWSEVFRGNKTLNIESLNISIDLTGSFLLCAEIIGRGKGICSRFYLLKPVELDIEVYPGHDIKGFEVSGFLFFLNITSREYSLLQERVSQAANNINRYVVVKNIDKCRYSMKINNTDINESVAFVVPDYENITLPVNVTILGFSENKKCEFQFRLYCNWGCVESVDNIKFELISVEDIRDRIEEIREIDEMLGLIDLAKDKIDYLKTLRDENGRIAGVPGLIFSAGIGGIIGSLISLVVLFITGGLRDEV